MNAYLFWYQAVSLELRLLAIRDLLSRAPPAASTAVSAAPAVRADDDWLAAYV